MPDTIELTDAQAATLNRALAGEQVDLTDEEAALLNEALGKPTDTTASTPSASVTKPAPAPAPATGVEGFIRDAVTPPSAEDFRQALGEPPPAGANAYAPVVNEKDPQAVFDAQRARVQAAFDALAAAGPVQQEAEVQTIADSLGVDASNVRDNLPAWRATFRDAGGHATKWLVDNPELARILFAHPEKGPLLIQSTKELSPITKAVIVGARLIGPMDPVGMLGEVYAKGKAVLGGERDVQKYQAGERAALDRALAPQQAQEVLDAEALRARGNPLDVAAIRFREARRQNERSRLGFAQMMRFLNGKDDSDIKEQIAAIDAQTPKALGEGSAMQVVSDTSTGIASSLDAFIQAGKAGGVFGAVAGLGTLAATRNPEAALAATRAAAGVGARYGMADATFGLETGSTYLDLGGVTDDTGKPLNPDVRAGAAIFAGILKTGVEMGEFELQVKTLGPAADAIRSGNLTALKKLLGTDAGFRSSMGRLAHIWHPAAEAAIGEPSEEYIQEGIDEAAQYGAKTVNQSTLTEGGVHFAKGPVLDYGGKMATAAGVAVPSAIAMALPGPLLAHAVHAINDAKATRTSNILPGVMELAQHPAAQAAPEAFADMVKDATGDSGAPLTAVYVEPGAIVRFFQDKPNATSDLEAALGEGAAKKVAEAFTSGQRVEVPTSTVMKSWGASEVGKATLQDTATSPDGMTLRQRTPEAVKANEEEAQRLAKEQLAKLEEDQVLNQRVKDFEDQATAARVEQVGPKQARLEAQAAAALVRNFMATQAKDFGQAVGELFPNTPLTVSKGEQVTQAPSALPQDLVDFEKNLSDAERRQLLYHDVPTLGGKEAGGSGLATRRAWDETKRTPGTQVGLITIPDVKAINDHLQGAHDVTNRLLRLAGKAVGDATTGLAARSGTNFLVEVRGTADLSSIVAKVQAAAPKGVQVLGFMGADTNAAFAAEEAGTKTRRALPEGNINRVLPRGQTAFDRSTLTDQSFPSEPAARGVPEALAQAPVAKGEAFVKDVLMDRQMPGVRSRLGFLAAGEMSHSLAIDLRGLKDINDAFGKERGDEVLALYAKAVRDLGGEDVYFAHMSGDEFAAKSNDPKKLEDFRDALREELSHLGVPVTLDGKEFYLTPLFRDGIAEGGYGKADQELNRRKSLEPAKPERAAADRAAAVDQLRRAGVLLEGTPGREGAGGPAADASARAGAGGQAVAGNEGATAAQAVAGGTRLYSGPHGYTDIPEARRAHDAIRVFLNPNANASTLVHETAHVFLEHLGDLAQRPDAPERTKATYDAALKGLGVEKRSDVKRAHHERFARSFEAWLFEGRAPKPALVSAFQSFKHWLVDIYRSVRGIPGAELNADLRSAFEALVATEDELNAFRKKQGPALEDAKATPEQRQAAQEAERVAMSEAGRRAELLALKDRLRVTEAWWKDGLEKLRTQFSEEYENLPARRVQRLIAGEEQGAQPIPLRRSEVEAVIGKARVPGMKLAEDGARLSDVADVTGYPSGTTMIAELAGLQSKKHWVAEHATAEMEAQHPSVLQERTELRRLVRDGLSSYAAKRVAEEAKIPKQERATVKRAAEVMAESFRVDNLHPSRALTAERVAAREKVAAAAKGEWQRVGEAARRELLNIHLFRELTGAQQEVEKLQGLAQRLAKTPAQERLGKSSPAFRDAVNFLLGNFGLGPDSGLSTIALQRAVVEGNADGTIIGPPDWLEPLVALSKQDVGQLTVAQMRQVTDALKQLQAASRDRLESIVLDKRMDFEVVKADVLQRFGETLTKKAPPIPAHQRNAIQNIGHLLDMGAAALISPITMFRQLLNDDQESLAWKALVLPLRRAEHFEADLLHRTTAPIETAFKALPDEVRRLGTDSIDGRALFPDHDERFLPKRRYELWMMALNAGSESNLDVLLRGRNITPEQLRNALNLLTKEEIDVINTIHRSIETLREPAFALEERVTGLRPKGVEAVPMQLANGTLEGGYFPLKAEPDGGRVGAQQAGEEQLAGLFDPTFTRPGTSHKYLISRTGASYVVSLDPSNLRKHIAQVTHDVAYREAVMSVGRLIMDPEVQRSLQDHLGVEKAKQFLPWLKDIGGGNATQANIGDVVMRFLKRNMATALLSGVNVAVGNFANLPAATTGTKLKTLHLAGAMTQMLRSVRVGDALTEPLHFDAADIVREKSGQYRAMENDSVAGLRKAEAAIFAGKVTRGMEWVREAGLTAMKTVDRMVSSTVWLGAYRQALAEGKPEAQAIRWADDILTQVQPQSSPVERAGILRSKGWLGTVTMFYGYLSVAYQQQSNIAAPLFTQEFQTASLVKQAKMAGSVAGGLLGFYLAYQAVGEFLMARGPEDGDKDPEDPENEVLKWRNWLFRKMVAAPLSLIPVLPLSQIVEGLMLGHAPESKSDALQGVAVQLPLAGLRIYKALFENGDAEPAVWAALRAVGLATGAPVRLVEPSAKYLWRLQSGQAQPASAAEAVSNTVYGEKRGNPATPLNPFPQ